jgi:hypothetical protein
VNAVQTVRFEIFGGLFGSLRDGRGEVGMPEVRIYRPAKNAMQSGRANTRHWVVEFEPTDRKEPDPLMGWNGSGDTRSQVQLRFGSKQDAVAFAEREGLSYILADESPAKALKAKSYADNFRFDRVT